MVLDASLGSLGSNTGKKANSEYEPAESSVRLTIFVSSVFTDVEKWQVRLEPLLPFLREPIVAHLTVAFSSKILWKIIASYLMADVNRMN